MRNRIRALRGTPVELSEKQRAKMAEMQARAGATIAEPSFLGEVFDMVNPLDPMHAFPQVFNRNERQLLGPYCGTAPH